MTYFAKFARLKIMVVESEALKAQNCALSKFSLPMHSNEDLLKDQQWWVERDSNLLPPNTDRML